MINSLKILFIFLTFVMQASCKKSGDPTANNDSEYLTCSIDGQAFSGIAVKPSTGDFYTGNSSGLGSDALSLVFGDVSNTFFIQILNFTRKPGTFTLDGRYGKSGYALFKQDDGKAQWTNTSNISITVTSFSNNVAEGTFAFTLQGLKDKVFTNGKFRSKVVIH